MKQQRRENSVSNWSKGKGIFVPSGPTGFMSFETWYWIFALVFHLFCCSSSSAHAVCLFESHYMILLIVVTLLPELLLVAKNHHCGSCVIDKVLFCLYRQNHIGTN